MQNLQIISQNGQYLVDSREVAKMIDIRHSDLLEKIVGYVEHLLDGKFRSVEFFKVSTYRDSTNRELPNFLITKKGCDMIANKLTGKKGVQFTAAYVTKFEEMERQTQPPIHQLSPELQMFKSILDTQIKQELQLKEAQQSATQALTAVTNIKETIIQEYDNWRDEINRLFNRIQKATGQTYSELRTQTYEALEQRARCDLSTRLRNLKERLAHEGATKTKINNTSKLDIIEADQRLKQIYTQIIKELAVKYVA